jgi:glycosyltransferase involved in cell wall biosynthesis
MSKADFNEAQFLPSPGMADRYLAIVEAGYERMKDLKIVIGGLARNVASVLPATMDRIERTGKMFKDYRVVIVENDSSDNTPNILNSWSKSNNKVSAICTSRGDPVNPGTRCLKRATRMARYRNACREEIVNRYANDFTHVILVDTDLGVRGWSYDGIANTFGWSGWDSVGSNGIKFLKSYRGEKNRPVHFDVWAFRWAESWKPVMAYQINPRCWARGESIVKLNSCFGGMGIYKMAAMQQSRYDGSDCEHVPFHRGMEKAGFGNRFMNPSQFCVY